MGALRVAGARVVGIHQALAPAPRLLVRGVSYAMRRASFALHGRDDGFGVRHGHALEAEGLHVGNVAGHEAGCNEQASLPVHSMIYCEAVLDPDIDNI